MPSSAKLSGEELNNKLRHVLCIVSGYLNASNEQASYQLPDGRPFQFYLGVIISFIHHWNGIGNGLVCFEAEQPRQI